MKSLMQKSLDKFMVNRAVYGTGPFPVKDQSPTTPEPECDAITVIGDEGR